MRSGFSIKSLIKPPRIVTVTIYQLDRRHLHFYQMNSNKALHSSCQGRKAEFNLNWRSVFLGKVTPGDKMSHVWHISNFSSTWLINFPKCSKTAASPTSFPCATRWLMSFCSQSQQLLLHDSVSEAFLLTCPQGNKLWNWNVTFPLQSVKKREQVKQHLVHFYLTSCVNANAWEKDINTVNKPQLYPVTRITLEN